MTRPVLVLVPGLGSDAWIWAQQRDALSDTAEVVIADTRSDDTLGGMAERLLAAAPARFSLAGISMGGFVCLEVMQRAPGRVERLALFDTTAHPDSAERTRQRAATAALIRDGASYAGLTQRGRAAMLHPATPDAVAEGVVEMALRVGVDAYLRQNAAAMARADYRPLLSTIAVPTLVAVGAEDRTTPPALSREIAAAVAGAVLEVIDGAGHLPPVEQPARVTALLREWLAR